MSSAQLGEEEQTTVNEIDPSDVDKGSSPKRNGAKRSGKKAQPHASPFYNNLVPAYQALWPAMAKRRIHASIKALDIPDGTNLLEVGVGTGMSLKSYPHNISVTGVDLSEAMLSEAKQTIREHGLNHINVLPMNAEELTFPDSTFDMVTSFHTISVVSEPKKMMSEINHFRSDNPLIAKVVDQAGNITKRLGWRTDLEVNEVLGELPLRLDERYKTNPFSLFTVMKATYKP
jgi:phosphatidylethanolamine/phosphatidyl-N-methylethanolamine N-methyltransferase